MTKSNLNRLSLSRETVRELTAEALNAAAGGNVNTLALACLSAICSASSCCPGVGCNSAQSQCGAGC